MKKTYLIILAILAITLSACTSNNKDSTITTSDTTTETTSTESTEVIEDVSVKDKLVELEDFLREIIWNEGFVNISHFTHDGKNSIGATMDIDFLIRELDKSMETKKEYDVYISELDDEKYSEIKFIWDKLSPEIDKLYNKLKENPPVAKDSSYNFDTGLYKQYSNAFEKAVKELEE